MSVAYLTSAGRAMRKNTIAILITFGLFGGWLNFARLDGAVLAPGVLTTQLSTRSIQHAEGGIIGEIFVEEGELVEEGQLLLRLDPTQRQASSRLFTADLNSALVRRARLEAEVSNGENVVLPPEVVGTSVEAEVARTIEDELEQFAIAREALNKRTELLQTQISQAEEEIKAHQLRNDIAVKEYDLVSEDLRNLQDLRERGLANQARVTELRRDQLELEGTIAQSEISIASIRQEVTGLRLEIESAVNVYRQRASEALDIVNRDIRSLQRDAVVAADFLRRIEIYAPVTGTVQESSDIAVGSVVGSGQVLMKIAPETNDYVLDLRVAPNDIENMFIGTLAEIRFPAFQSVELPPFQGELTAVSRDRVTDPVTQIEFFEARARLYEDSIPEEIRSRLVAGMNATVVLPVAERTALDYLVSPILRGFEGAMREE